jgi:hypothetical protein
VEAQEQPNKDGIRVEVVATASEYVPRTTTVSHPGHAYTDCQGHTSYFGDFDFHGSENSGSIRGTGEISGTANTDTRCSTTFTPPSESTLTTYRRVNYTIVKGEHALYLLSCTQVRRLTVKEGLIIAAMSKQEDKDKAAANAKGRWTDCPAFSIGDKYALSVRNTSDARLEGTSTRKPVKLEYLSSAPLPVPSTQPQAAPAPQTQPASAPAGEARVHITSSPSGGEIYVDGKFFGNTPSDVTLATGEHTVRITVGGKEWTRTVQITTGEIHLHAET